MFYRKEWTKINRIGPSYIFEGWFLFGFLPLYIVRRRIK